MFSFLTSLAGSAAVGWTGRRLLEVGGWLTTIISAVLLLPPEHQATVIALLSGQGGALSVAAYFGLAVYLWSQFMSWRATTKPQVVSSEGKKHTLPVLTEAQARDLVEQQTGRRPTEPVTRR